MISLLFSLNCLILETDKTFTINVGNSYISDDKFKIPFENFTISNFKEQLFRKPIIKSVIQVPDNMDLLNVKVKTKDEITKLGTGTMMNPEFLLANYFNDGDKKPEKDQIHIAIIVPTGRSEHSDKNPQQAGIILEKMESLENKMDELQTENGHIFEMIARREIAKKNGNNAKI